MDGEGHCHWNCSVYFNFYCVFMSQNCLIILNCPLQANYCFSDKANTGWIFHLKYIFQGKVRLRIDERINFWTSQNSFDHDGQQHNLESKANHGKLKIILNTIPCKKQDNLRIQYRGGVIFWIYFGINNTQIYRF